MTFVNFLIFALIFVLSATVIVLISGLFMMVAGGKNTRLTNKIMQARILLQGLALIIFALLLFLKA